MFMAMLVLVQMILVCMKYKEKAFYCNQQQDGLRHLGFTNILLRNYLKQIGFRNLLWYCCNKAGIH